MDANSWYNRPGLRWLRFFRIEVDRKADLLAVIAFLISTGGLSYDIFLAYKDPDILHFPPDQIVFHREESNGVQYLHVGARSSYLNVHQGDRNVVLNAERLLFDLGGKSYELKWQSFIDYSNKEIELVKDNVRPATPVVIKAGEGVSHETHFAPRSFRVGAQRDAQRYKNFLRWEDFLSEFEKIKELDVRIVSEFYSLKNREVRVYVEIAPGVIYSLKENHWAAPSAWPR